MMPMPAQQRGQSRWTADVALLALTIAIAAIVSPLAAAAGVEGMIAVVALAAVVIVATRPEWGAYLYLLVTPLIVGIARSDTLLIRPNEGLLGLILIALSARALILMLRGQPYRFTINRVDLALLLMSLCASLIPLAFRYARSQPISSDDLLYAFVLWKYFVVYRVFREAVTSPEQVAVCLWLAMTSAVVVAVVAVLQVTNLFGVPEFLLAYYDDPFGGSTGTGSDRGTSTIASSFGVANVMAMNLAIVLVMFAGGHPRRNLLVVAGGVFVLGCVATGQFSGFLGLMIVAGAVTCIAARARMLLTAVALAGAIAGLILWPVIAERLSGFDTLAGLPPSWVGRLNNLQRFIWPELFSGWNWIVGVRPAARIAAPEPWREWVFIESGYTWLLWTGGLPMLLAFAFFVRCSLKDLWLVVRGPADLIGVAAAASFSWLIAMSVLMLFDPHLTIRGSADLFFPLLALAFVRRIPVHEPAACRTHGPRVNTV
jgi:hypothetical protein